MKTLLSENNSMKKIKSLQLRNIMIYLEKNSKISIPLLPEVFECKLNLLSKLSLCNII